MLTKTTYEHILIDDHGIPQIAGANTKVVELVLDNIAYGWSPEELAFQHSHLTLGQSIPPWPTTGITGTRSTKISSDGCTMWRAYIVLPWRPGSQNDYTLRI